MRRAVSIFGGQTLVRHAKDAFGHHHPDYDPATLAAAVCGANGRGSIAVHFHIGIAEAKRSPMWHGYRTHRLIASGHM